MGVRLVWLAGIRSVAKGNTWRMTAYLNWQLVIGAIFFGIGSLLMYFGNQVRQDKEAEKTKSEIASQAKSIESQIEN